MFQLQIDSAQNVLRLDYSGVVNAEEAQRCFEQFQSLLPSTKPGFQLLTDLTGLTLMELTCAPFVRKVMDLCNKHGVSRVVRVIPDPSKDIGLNIMSLFHYRREISIITCATLDEGLQALTA